MSCNFLNHSGLSSIQYKTFFHMCRLESISFDMESRSGSTFCLYDCLATGVIGMLTIGVRRGPTVKFMMDALNFIQNQAGTLPKKAYISPGSIPENQRKDQIAMYDVVQRVKVINRALEKTQKDGDGSEQNKDKISFIK